MRRLLIYTALMLSAVTSLAAERCDSVNIAYRLHGQTRRFNTTFTHRTDGSLLVDWYITRNLQPWHGSYTVTPEAVKGGDALSYVMPENGDSIVLPGNMTFTTLSRDALRTLLRDGRMRFDRLDWTLTSSPEAAVLEAVNARYGARITVANDPDFPLILSMDGNPVEIDWTATPKTSRPLSPREQITERPERSGGIYYAYPVTADVMPDIPAGYHVAFLSHYGRHGSRWLIKTWEYDETLAALDSAARVNGLTPSGADVLARLNVIASQARGKQGALSPLGERQHAAIASRMVSRFPTLFTDSARIVAHSSIEPRCIMSMGAFSERLKEINPRLTVNRHADPGDMRFISYSSPEAKAVNAPESAWWNDLGAWRDSVLDPTRLMASLFTDPSGVPDGRRLMWMLHDVAVDVQDVEPGVELLDIFTDDERYHLWTALNYKMYYLHGNNPATGCAGPMSARNLLDHIAADLDSVADGTRSDRTVTLRFGHDTALLRLLALMQVEGASASVADPREYAAAWQDYNLTPMAANLQIIMLLPDAASEAEPLVMIRHNERPARITGLEPLPGGYYPWRALRARFVSRQ